MRKRVSKSVGVPQSTVEFSTDVEEDDDDTPSLFEASDEEEVAPLSKGKRWGELTKVGAAFAGFRPASESLTVVRAVPTIFIQYDHGTRVGGHPTERIALLHGPSGEGKFVAIDEPVLTPMGWKAIGSLVVGDAVTGSDGDAYRVVGVYPQGVRELFRVTFSDGTSVEAGEEHLWSTRTMNEKSIRSYTRGSRPNRKRIPTGKEAPFVTRSTKEIAQTIGDRHEIPMVSAVRFAVSERLVIDPYLMGLLLGDGGFTGTQLTFSKPEEDVQQEVESLLLDGDHLIRITDKDCRINGGHTFAALEAVGLRGCRSWEKFIPDAYRTANPANRLALLRGLIDTDGSVTKDGQMVEFSSSSPRMFAEVVDLARGLGAYVSTTSKPTPEYLYLGKKRVGRPAWRARISFNDGTIPVRSLKHLAKWIGRDTLRQKRIVSIVPTRSAECVCIAVDAPDRLYILRDYILTHNTYFTLGETLSFLQVNNPVLMIDAERTTDKGFAKLALGDYAEHPLFFYERPETYEEVVQRVRKWCHFVSDYREEGKLHEDACGLIIIDSIRKMVPEDQWKRILELSKPAPGEKKEKLRDRSAQIKALMNSAWCDELVPLLEQTGCTMIIIARETDDPSATERQKMFGGGKKTGGGSALYYDASLDIRVERAKYVTKEAAKDGKEGEYAKPTVYGERHRITIKKSKIAGKDDKSIICYFHTSNGVFIPAGFDKARDVLELARRVGVVTAVVTKSKKGEKAKKPKAGGGGWMTWNSHRWQGEHNAVKKLTDSPDVLADLEAAVRSQFKSASPIEIDADGVILSDETDFGDDE